MKRISEGSFHPQSLSRDDWHDLMYMYEGVFNAVDLMQPEKGCFRSVQMENFSQHERELSQCKKGVSLLIRDLKLILL